MEGLANLLSPQTPKPTDFRTIEYLGYFENNCISRYGQDSKAPRNAITIYAVSLCNLLNISDHVSLPDLGENFAVAKNLSNPSSISTAAVESMENFVPQIFSFPTAMTTTETLTTYKSHTL